MQKLRSLDTKLKRPIHKFMCPRQKYPPTDNIVLWPSSTAQQFGVAFDINTYKYPQKFSQIHNPY